MVGVDQNQAPDTSARENFDRSRTCSANANDGDDGPPQGLSGLGAKCGDEALSTLHRALSDCCSLMPWFNPRPVNGNATNSMPLAVQEDPPRKNGARADVCQD
jgi:hypothetical protein